MRWIDRLNLSLAVMAIAVAVAPAPAQTAPSLTTALDDYVAKPDATYSWQLVGTYPQKDSTTFVLHLKSQTWRTPAEVNRTVWEHAVVVVVPKVVESNHCFLFVTGGANDRPMPKGADATTARIAATCKSIVAEIKMIPNQPLIFHNDGVPRKEDDLIGYSWAQYLKTGDATWLPRLPMVKSVVRAMDCIQEFAKSEAGGGKAVEKFVVAGGSKRGWTTWLTGVADKRVAAIVPIVIDVANVSVSMRHHAAVYGFWAESIGDYVHHGIMKAWEHPRLADLYKIVDPYSYRDRLTLPKFVVNAAGDQFFVPDSSQFYYGALIGEKLLRYVPNADHSLKNSDAVESIAAFYQMIIAGKPRPTMDWTFEADGSIVLTANPTPKNVKLWAATNPKARDFRLEEIGPAYRGSDVAANAEGRYVGKIEAPSTGWTAYFLEATFDTGLGKVPLKASTAVRVVPDRVPFQNQDPSKVPYEGRRPRKRA